MAHKADVLWIGGKPEGKRDVVGRARSVGANINFKDIKAIAYDLRPMKRNIKKGTEETLNKAVALYKTDRGKAIIASAAVLGISASMLIGARNDIEKKFKSASIGLVPTRTIDGKTYVLVDNFQKSALMSNPKLAFSKMLIQATGYSARVIDSEGYVSLYAARK